MSTPSDERVPLSHYVGSAMLGAVLVGCITSDQAYQWLGALTAVCVAFAVFRR